MFRNKPLFEDIMAVIKPSSLTIAEGSDMIAVYMFQAIASGDTKAIDKAMQMLIDTDEKIEPLFVDLTKDSPSYKFKSVNQWGYYGVDKDHTIVEVGTDLITWAFYLNDASFRHLVNQYSSYFYQNFGREFLKCKDEKGNVQSYPNIYRVDYVDISNREHIFFNQRYETILLRAKKCGFIWNDTQYNMLSVRAWIQMLRSQDVSAKVGKDKLYDLLVEALITELQNPNNYFIENAGICTKDHFKGGLFEALLQMAMNKLKTRHMPISAMLEIDASVRELAAGIDNRSRSAYDALITHDTANEWKAFYSAYKQKRDEQSAPVTEPNPVDVFELMATFLHECGATPLPQSREDYLAHNSTFTELRLSVATMSSTPPDHKKIMQSKEMADSLINKDKLADEIMSLFKRDRDFYNNLENIITNTVALGLLTEISQHQNAPVALRQIIHATLNDQSALTIISIRNMGALKPAKKHTSRTAEFFQPNDAAAPALRK